MKKRNRSFKKDPLPKYVQLLVRTTPQLSALILFILYMAPPPFGFLTMIKPLLLLITVFYWMVYRPDLLSLGTLFAFGIIEDLVSVTPVGINTLCYILLYIAVNGQQSFFIGKSFVETWWVFSITSFGFIFLKWFFISISQAAFIPFYTTFFCYLMTVMFYPLIAQILSFVQNKLLKEI